MKKNVKNDKKKLVDPKKSVTFAAQFDKTNFTMVFEKSSPKPCDAWKPKEALSIREMLIRSERGQILDVHTRFRAENIPDNMYAMELDERGNIKPDKFEETFDHTPPDDVNDITDLMRYSEEIAQRKKDLIERRKKSVANAPKSAPTVKDEPTKKEPTKDEPTKEE